MPGKKILWLCSWYPNKAEPFNGDFIQRHARAAALFNDIYVIHVGAYTGNKVSRIVESKQVVEKVTEKIICFNKSLTFWGRLKAHFRLLRTYRKAVLQYIEENGKPDLVHVHVPVWSGLLAIWVQKEYDVPYIVSEHWGIYNEIEKHNFNTKSSHFKRASKGIFSRAKFFVSVSKFLAEGVNKMVTQKEYRIIPNTVNTSLFYFPRDIEKKKFRFIHVSNMVPLKNAEGILRSFRQFLVTGTEAELVMVGDTDPMIRKYAVTLYFPPGTVQFRGEIPYTAVAKEMQLAHALILFSNIENSPCVIGEALCSGLPVVATRVGGIPELVDESNAVLVDAGDEKALIHAMEIMMLTYQDFDRLKISQSAAKKFSYEKVGEMMDELYKETS